MARPFSAVGAGKNVAEHGAPSCHGAAVPEQQKNREPGNSTTTVSPGHATAHCTRRALLLRFVVPLHFATQSIIGRVQLWLPINGYHGDPDEMLRRQPPAYSVQASCTDILLLPHSRPHFMTVSSHPICYMILLFRFPLLSCLTTRHDQSLILAAGGCRLTHRRTIAAPESCCEYTINLHI